MDIARYTALWNQISMRVDHIEYTMLEQNKRLSKYEMPLHGYIYVTGGSGQLVLDDYVCRIEPFHLLHAGKGMKLSLRPGAGEEGIACYLIFYRPNGEWEERQALPDDLTLLRTRYHLQPEQPLVMRDRILHMYDSLRTGDALHLYRVHALFGQMMYEILHQLGNEDQQHMLDPVAQAMRYMEEHYTDPCTMDELADRLGCSTRHLSRLFRKQGIGQSPSSYLLHLRMERACELLTVSRLSVQEIARSVGYEDVYHFSRMFKKYSGLAPGLYRQQQRRPNMPSGKSDFSIAAIGNDVYIDNNSQKEKSSGGSHMMYNYSRRSAVWMLLLSFSLLLGACSSAAPNTNSNATSGNESVQSATAENGMRTIQHDLGSTDVKENPERIVVLEQGFTQTVAALKVKPVGVADDNKPERFPQDTLSYIEGYTSVGTRSEPNLEVIRTLKPDLIIADTSRHTNVYDQLSDIAPTIVFKNDTANYDEIVQSTEQIGLALGKEQDVQTLLNDHKQQMETLRQAVQQGQSVLIIAPDEEESNSFQVRTTSSFHGSFLAAAGLDYALKDDAEVSQLMTTEQLMAIDPQHLLILINEDNDSVLDAQKDNPLWNQLQAVQHGQAHEVELATWSRQRSLPALNNIMNEAAGYF
ncbi:ABC transporter substrate-binding protein [Paenibacillus sp. WLX2291]|uniref:ABC transporter substrate-binding protein n=1 Tax=Paenibacillus sp. WLX2291 TaxID=3296934 RepID=UPI0039841C4E